MTYKEGWAVKVGNAGISSGYNVPHAVGNFGNKAHYYKITDPIRDRTAIPLKSLCGGMGSFGDDLLFNPSHLEARMCKLCQSKLEAEKKK